MRNPVRLVFAIVSVALLGQNVSAAPATPSASALATAGVTMSIQLDGSSFPPRGPIPVEITFRNQAQTAVVLRCSPAFGAYLQFHVVSSDTGKELVTELSGEERVVNLHLLDPVSLRPGETWQHTFDVTHFVRFPAQGSYSLQVVYPRGLEPQGSGGVPSELRSNVVGFSIGPGPIATPGWGVFALFTFPSAQFHVGSPIILSAVFENPSQDILEVVRPLRFTVQPAGDPQASFLPAAMLNEQVTRLRREKSFVLHPGKSWQETYDLNQLFQVRSPGVYEVFIRYYVTRVSDAARTDGYWGPVLFTVIP